MMNNKNDKQSANDEYIGNCWSVRKEDEKFYFEYISGELAGRIKEIEIAEADFISAKQGKLGMEELCIKYGLS